MLYAASRNPFMKNVFILLSVFFWTSATAQFSVVSGDEFEIEVPKMHRIQYNYFNKGLVRKAVVKYINPTSNEIFYYKYDTISNDPIDVRGYKDGKLIY